MFVVCGRTQVKFYIFHLLLFFIYLFFSFCSFQGTVGGLERRYLLCLLERFLPPQQLSANSIQVIISNLVKKETVRGGNPLGARFGTFFIYFPFFIFIPYFFSSFYASQSYCCCNVKIKIVPLSGIKSKSKTQQQKIHIHTTEGGIKGNVWKNSSEQNGIFVH